jgi:hypothetical protein
MALAQKAALLIMTAFFPYLYSICIVDCGM